MNQETVCAAINPYDPTMEEGQIFAFDVPHEVSAGEAARLIDAGPPEGFYAWQVLPWPGVGARVFCKRSKVTNPTDIAVARRRTADETRKLKDAEDEQADAAVARIIARSPRATTGTVRVRLVAVGFRRGTDWVAESMRRARPTA